MTNFIKFHGLSLSDNSYIENLSIESLVSDPIDPLSQRLWYNSTEQVIKYSEIIDNVTTIRNIVNSYELNIIITTINDAISTETTDRIAADAVLSTNLATEVTDRIAADAVLTTNLATETTDRIAADTLLTTNLSTEVTDRTAADAVLTTNLATETTDRTAADDVLTTNLATEVSDRIDDINNISSILNNFSYDGHDNNVLNDTHPTGLMLDKQTGKYKPSLLNLGHFIPFKRKNGDVDDINLISTFDGNVLIDSKLRFWQHNGIQDDISFIIQ